MKHNLKYLADKILSAQFINEPFKHIYIEDFFSEEHFNEIIRSKQIVAPKVSTDAELIDKLEEVGYEAIKFPGCITNKNKYLSWLQEKKNEIPKELQSWSNTACEGFGMVFRLKKLESDILSNVNDYICGKEFNEAIAQRYDINLEKCYVDSGIQKYLNKYEISPHPDIRKKATTFMVNINPSNASEKMDHHTHYMRFKSEYKYVQKFWETNSDKDRCWVPWEWAETIKTQTKNNSIVIFSPNDDTLHGVKASYDHLVTQRTQLYGNMWYNDVPGPGKNDPTWKDFVQWR